ncbi:hypothetical protein BH10BAC6_BH10BAC6_04460 [soil metagenome]
MIATSIRFMLALMVFIVPVLSTHATNADDVFRAMDDELKRSMSELKLGDLQRPYNIEYSLSLRKHIGVHGVLGSIQDVDTGMTATLTVRIRVGTATFDNTNFFDVGLGFFGSSDDEEAFRNRRIPYELSYSMLRRELWLATDACYKQAVEILAKKEAAIKNRTRTDSTPDFVAMMPERLTDLGHAGVNGSLDVATSICTATSEVFASFPAIQISRVGYEFVPEETFYLNSEGRRVQKVEVFTGFEAVATAQASDGMPLAETYAAYSIKPSDMPSKDSLVRAMREIAQRLTDLTTAPTIEAYSGPVLFEGQAAAEVLAQHFTPNLVAQRTPLSDGGFGSNERYGAFQNKIGARVLPEFLSVRDVPSKLDDAGRPVAGHYQIDDEGIPAQDVAVVDKGFLRALLSSRVPTKRAKATNGHQRGGGAMLSTMEVTSDGKHRATSKELKARMMKLVKDRELPFGIIVRKALNQNILFTGIFPLVGMDYPVPQGDAKLGLLEVYRVFPDGREELIRGTEAAGLSPQLFKDILNCSKQTTVHNYLAASVIPSFMTGGSQYLISSIITPDLLFEDVEIRPLEGDFPKPPILANPLQ